VVPIFIFYLIWTYGIRRMAERQGFGGLMAIGKSRAKVYVETDTKVTFRDVAGVDEANFRLSFHNFLPAPESLPPYDIVRKSTQLTRSRRSWRFLRACTVGQRTSVVGIVTYWNVP
jgi:hypothetical protein